MLVKHQKHMRLSLLIVGLMIFCLSCKKENQGGETVEIYQLKTFQTVSGKCQVDPSVSVLQDTPTIKNRDILMYDQGSYEYTLTDTAIQKIRNIYNGTPFAVTVDKQLIYYGIFKPAISSSSCDESITMDIAWSANNKIYMRLGYPGTTQGISIDDQRNNAKLLATLKKQGKLR
jgi:hypothetical protein